MPLVHIAGRQTRVDNRIRQRCSWCGTVLAYYDLTRTMVMVQPGEEPRPPAMWEEGAFVAVDGGAYLPAQGGDRFRFQVPAGDPDMERALLAERAYLGPLPAGVKGGTAHGSSSTATSAIVRHPPIGSGSVRRASACSRLIGPSGPVSQSGQPRSFTRTV